VEAVMGELARGNITDRPWGRTLGALALRGLSGQLDVRADGRVYSIAFDQGVVVGAASPLANDAAVRVALTGGLISSTQVNDLSRRLAAARGRDEIDVIAEALRLQPDQATRLRRRVVAQRAARSFSIDHGEFVVEDRVTLAIIPGSELDIRSVVYMGARNNLSDQRLEAELEQMGTLFTLKPEADADLPYFGFAENERAIVERLRSGASLLELRQAAPEIDGRTQRAIVYSLVSCAACNATVAPPAPVDLDPPTHLKPVMSRTASTSGPVVARTSSASGPVVARTSSTNAVPQPVTRMPSPQRSQPTTASPPMSPRSQSTTAVPPTRAKQPTVPPEAADAGVRMRSPTGAPSMPSLATTQPMRTMSKPATARAKRNTAETRETEELIQRKLLDARGDHFQVLGVARTATADEIRLSYFTLARKLHPDRLSALGITDDSRAAQQLFAQINTAFSVLNDPGKRDEYSRVLARGGEAAVRAEESQAEELAMRVMNAEEAFRRGEMALRRDQLQQALQAFGEAVELQPKEMEYQTYLAWTKFAAAPDKNAVAAETRKSLQRAAEGNDRSPTARFYLGRVERMLGREREALALFQEVLMMKPNHTEAASEARVLEQRLKKR
jgi:DnaJ domain